MPMSIYKAEGVMSNTDPFQSARSKAICMDLDSHKDR